MQVVDPKYCYVADKERKQIIQCLMHSMDIKSDSTCQHIRYAMINDRYFFSARDVIMMVAKCGAKRALSIQKDNLSPGWETFKEHSIEIKFDGSREHFQACLPLVQMFELINAMPCGKITREYKSRCANMMLSYLAGNQALVDQVRANATCNGLLNACQELPHAKNDPPKDDTQETVADIPEITVEMIKRKRDFAAAMGEETKAINDQSQALIVYNPLLDANNQVREVKIKLDMTEGMNKIELEKHDAFTKLDIKEKDCEVESRCILRMSETKLDESKNTVEMYRNLIHAERLKKELAAMNPSADNTQHPILTLRQMAERENLGKGLADAQLNSILASVGAHPLLVRHRAPEKVVENGFEVYQYKQEAYEDFKREFGARRRAFEKRHKMLPMGQLTINFFGPAQAAT